MVTEAAGGSRVTSVKHVGWSVAVVLLLLLSVSSSVPAASATEAGSGNAAVLTSTSGHSDVDARSTGGPFTHPRPVPYTAVTSGVTADAGGAGGWLDGLFPWDHDANVPPSWVVAGQARLSTVGATVDGARDSVLDAVRENPGVHLSKVAADSEFHRSTVRYHVRVLVDEGVLQTDKARGKRRLYPNEWDSSPEFGILADDSPRRIAEVVATHGSPSVTTIADEVDLAVSTVSYHLDRLAEADVVRRNHVDSRTEVSLVPEARARLDGHVDGNSEDHPLPI